MPTLTNISSIVDEVFDQMECAWRSDISHEGTTVAYLDFHGCGEGWICSAHHMEFLSELPYTAAMIVEGAPCAACGNKFPTIESWVKVYLL